ncbi:hypothetical protein FBD94_01250 [Pedobacter hiemivivus]|uniref:Neutral/alkaline non-lysosomal ceramidase N-terminal domain-containing protein n=1 Tax=Pedobacter hiemivivus TaxID=2530454 RepID=A0A4U1GLG5_9SPHI|nr:hypothetical protein [Pedobacter hiemivivus]TKC65211.1 hypothetical protein FBD94_01250 [Pedobacter hiemivivus]
MKIQYQIIFIGLAIAGLFVIPVKAQQTYLSGTARSSIEPRTYPFSVALAGYGYPRGGRFSLEWIKMDNVRWGKLAGHSTTFTVLDKVMYAADKNGAVTYAPIKRKNANWRKLTELEGIISLASYKGRLFALTANDELMRFELKNKNADWVKIAKFNGLSYDVHLKSIAINNGKLYGLDKNNNIFEGRHRTDGNLSVSAVAVAAEKQTVLIVGTDVCGFNYDFISSIKQQVFRKHKIPPSAVLINASHTHFAPSTQDWTTWGGHQLPDSVYLNDVVKPAMIAVIESAIKSMKPSVLSFGRGKTTIGANRSLEGAEVPYDNDVDVLSIERVKDHHKTLVFLTGCHPVFKNEGIEGFTVSPNYPGVTRALLEKETGVTDALFIQGCGGDINPLSNNHVKTGNDLAADVKRILNSPLQKLSGKVTFYLDSVNFPLDRWSNERIATFRKENDNGKADVNAEKNVRWADLMFKLDKSNKMPASMPVYIQTINIGNWKLVGLSREAVTDYSIGVKKLWPGKLVSVAGYCNDVSSYLPTSRHMKAGSYEGLGSFFWYGQPSVFPLNVYETIIDKIKTQNY